MYEKVERYDTRRWIFPLKSEDILYAAGEEWKVMTNSYRKSEAAQPKQKWCSVVDVSGGEIKVWYCKEKYYIGTWNGRCTNEDKFDMVKPEMARMNIDIVGISEPKWTGMVNSIQMTIISTAVGKNPLEEKQ